MRKRAVTLSRLVYETGDTLVEYAKWPHVESRRIAADNAVEELREALHGYDPIVPRSIMLTLVGEMLEMMFVRDCPVAGIRLAFDKMIDIFDAEKAKGKAKAS